MKNRKRYLTWMGVIGINILISTGCAEAAISRSATIQNSGADQTESFSSCSKYGNDSIETLNQASIYETHYFHKNFDDALESWRYVYTNAPGYDSSLYQIGIVLYQNKINSQSDSIEKEKFIDTLLMLYDKRIECFGRKGYVLGRKGYDMMRFRPYDIESIRLTLKEAIEESGLNSEYFILYPYLDINIKNYRKNLTTKEELFSLYEEIMKISEYNIARNVYPEQYKAVIDGAISYLTIVKVLSCENLVPYIKEKYKTDPDNQDIWRKGLSMLKSCNDCDDTFMEMYKKLFEVEPTADLAIKIAACETEKNNYNEGINYLNKTIALETDKEQKAKLSYNIATIYNKLQNFSKAREYCYQALEYKPNWGDPYILIGKLYAASGKLCGPGTGIKSQAVIWVAYDKWEKAKSIDPSVAAEANKLINNYNEFLPSGSDLFQLEIAEGSPYTINCWINETTTVRAKK